MALLEWFSFVFSVRRTTFWLTALNNEGDNWLSSIFSSANKRFKAVIENRFQFDKQKSKQKLSSAVNSKICVCVDPMDSEKNEVDPRANGWKHFHPNKAF